MPLAPRRKKVVILQKQSTPADDVFTFYKEFISKERPGLRTFYQDEDLKVLAETGANLIKRLTEDGCGSEDAKFLSLLVLYELRVLIDAPTAWADEENGIRKQTLCEALSLITKVNDLANPETGISYVVTPNGAVAGENVTNENFQSILGGKDESKEHFTPSGNLMRTVVAHSPGPTVRIGGWDFWYAAVDTLRASGSRPKPLLVITLLDGKGYAGSELEEINVRFAVRLSIDCYGSGDEAIVFQFGRIGDDQRAINCLKDELSIMSEQYVRCMPENDRLEDLKNVPRKWDLLRKLLVGSLMPSNRHLDHRLETEFCSPGSCVIHTTYLRNCESPESGSTIVKTRWSHAEDLGSGAFGTVTLQKSDDDQPQLRAVKHIHKYDDRLREVKALCKVMDRDDLFVKFLGWYTDKSLNGIYIAMEYIKEGDLSWWLQDGQTIDEATTHEITKQVLQGLSVLHERHICHRDLKPQNILVASLNPHLHVKIADFGASKHTEKTELRTRIGTNGYLAPEILGLLNSVENLGRFTFAIDIWSLGCLVYQMLTSSGPFVAEKTPPTTSDTFSEESAEESNFGNLEPDMVLFYKFCNDGAPLPVEKLDMCNVSKEAKQFIKGILKADPASRPSADDCLRSIKEWVPSEEVGSYEIVSTCSGEEIKGA